MNVAVRINVPANDTQTASLSFMPDTMMNSVSQVCYDSENGVTFEA